MIPNENMAKIKSLADEVSRREGCRLYDVEFAGAAKSRVLCVFIEQDAQAASVTPQSSVVGVETEHLMSSERSELGGEKGSNPGRGVSVEQLANVSRGLSLLLDVEDLVPGGFYELEVSSPGVERPLREAWHFAGAIGQIVKVVTHDPVEGLKGEVRSIQGRLVSATDHGLEIEYGDATAPIPYVNVKRAHVVFSFNKNERKK